MVRKFISFLLLVGVISCGGSSKKSQKVATQKDSGPKYMDYQRIYLGQNGILYTTPMQPPQKSLETIVFDQNTRKIVVLPVAIENTDNLDTIYPAAVPY